MQAKDDGVAVRMFGPLEVRLGESRLGPRDFGGVKPKQLLELLLLERDRPVPKDRIADSLWGEELPQRAAATIETYVSVLRRRLDAGAGLGRRLILTHPGGYRLAAEEVAVDADRYDALLRRAAAGEADERRSALEAAVALAGHELLADEPYASWVIPTREHYRERQVQALVDLAECCLDLDDNRAALAAAEQALALEPTRERAHRAAMLAHHALGGRDEALRAYERCLDALAEELGVTPTAETAELHSAILRDEEPAVPVSRREQLSGPPLARYRGRSRIGYALNGDVRIAYQAVGDGPLDLVFSPSHVSNLAATWDEPTYAAFLRRLASMARRLTDPQSRLFRRLSIGDLSDYGLPVPPDGMFARFRATRLGPSVVDREVVDAIREGRIEVVAAVTGFDEHSVQLADGAVIEPDAVIAATGYRRGLESLVGHLGVLDPDGAPLVRAGRTHPAAPDLYFIGFDPKIAGTLRQIRIESKRLARAV